MSEPPAITSKSFVDNGTTALGTFTRPMSPAEIGDIVTPTMVLAAMTFPDKSFTPFIVIVVEGGTTPERVSTTDFWSAPRMESVGVKPPLI